MDLNATDLTAVIARIERLEAQNAIRNCIHRYMEICDHLSAETDVNLLMELFDANSIWEGIGEKYATTLGCYTSWQAIQEMFLSYTQGQAHFVLNAHFVNSEQIDFESNEVAKGTWMMLQCSSFHSDRHYLNAAKLRVEFKKQADASWKIKHFQTENVFSRPVSHWHSTTPLPVPQRKQDN